MGRGGDEERGRWEDGKMGRWEDRENTILTFPPSPIAT